MPQHKSAIKRVRQNAVRRTRNRQYRSRMRTMMKKLHTMEDASAAQEYLKDVKSLVDRLAGKGIIHKNKAAHYKSKMEKHVNSLA